MTIEDILAECRLRPRAASKLGTDEFSRPKIRRRSTNDWQANWSDANIAAVFNDVKTEEKALNEAIEIQNPVKTDLGPSKSEANLMTEGYFESEFQIELEANTHDALSEDFVGVDKTDEVKFETISTPFLSVEAVVDFTVRSQGGPRPKTALPHPHQGGLTGGGRFGA